MAQTEQHETQAAPKPFETALTAAQVLEDVRARAVQYDPFDSASDDELRAIAWLLKDETVTGDLANHLREVASRHLADAVGDRRALMDSRDWEYETNRRLAAGPPSAEESIALIDKLTEVIENNPAGTIELPADSVYAHVAWYDATRNFVVHEHADKQRTDNHGYDVAASSTEALLAVGALHRLIDAAKDGAQIDLADLEWARDALARLRSSSDLPDDDAMYIPPCLRATV